MNIIGDQDIMANRRYPQSVAHTILLCAVQNIGNHGYREVHFLDEESKAASIGYNCNHGNFLEILHVVAARDPVVEQRLLHQPKNAKYTHHSIQVEILPLLAQMIHRKSRLRFTKPHFFSLMCDETRDSGKREQISLCIRYVSEGTLCEKIYNFYRADGLSAAAITIKDYRSTRDNED